MTAYSTCAHAVIAYSEYDLSDQDEDETLTVLINNTNITLKLFRIVRKPYRSELVKMDVQDFSFKVSAIQPHCKAPAARQRKPQIG